MNGSGFIKGLGVTLRHFIGSYVDDLRYGFRKYSHNVDNFEQRQGTKAEGVFTVQYPDEKVAMAERFRFVPFLVVNDYDHADAPGKDWCTSCGICAKVCPPQCIWIVRNEDPATGRPIPEPEAFFIDIDICMNCGFCAEFCPFDAIKMDHDYELSSYDRTTNHVFDKPKLSKELRYWKTIAPTRAVEEMKVRGGWEHKDAQKAARRGGVTRDSAREAAAAPAAKAEVEAKDAKRDEVRARRAAAEAPAAAPAAEAPKAAAPVATAPAEGGAARPWEQSHDDREKAKAAALARKAARAAKRDSEK